MRKKLMCTILCTALLCSYSVSAENVQFEDISGHWAKDTIEKYAGNGYISGYPDGTFKPDGGVTVAEFCRIISAIKGINYKVSDGNWALPYIRKMIDMDVIGRNDFADFNAKMTREEVAKAVLSLMSGEYYPSNLDEYAVYLSDAQDIGTEYRDAVLKTYISGVIGGYEDGSWKPQNGVTRAEILSILERAFNKDMRQVPQAIQGTVTESPYQSYFYNAAVQVRYTTNASSMQYRLYGSDAVYMQEDDTATGLKLINEIQGAQGFAMVLRYDVSSIKENIDKLEKLYVDAQWAKNGSSEHALGIWYYTYSTDETDWNNNLYFRNLNGSAVASDDLSGYNSIISNITATLPTWGNSSMAVPNSEKTVPLTEAVRNSENKYIFDLTDIADEILARANDNNMVEFFITSVNYDGYDIYEDKPQIYIAGENAPKLNAEYDMN